MELEYFSDRLALFTSDDLVDYVMDDYGDAVPANPMLQNVYEPLYDVQPTNLAT